MVLSVPAGSSKHRSLNGRGGIKTEFLEDRNEEREVCYRRRVITDANNDAASRKRPFGLTQSHTRETAEQPRC